jgi:hypothetical protein
MTGEIYEVHLEMASGGIICIPSFMTDSVLLFFKNEDSRRRYWVFGLCPSSGFFLNNNEKTQRFGNWICFCPQVREDSSF